MKQLIRLLMMVGLLVGVVGCGDDDNPVKSNSVLLVGTWEDPEGDSWTFGPDSKYVDATEDGNLEGTWSLDGDQITITYSIDTIRDFIRTLIAAEMEGTVEDVSEVSVDEQLATFAISKPILNILSIEFSSNAVHIVIKPLDSAYSFSSLNSFSVKLVSVNLFTYLISMRSL